MSKKYHFPLRQVLFKDSPKGQAKEFIIGKSSALMSRRSHENTDQIPPIVVLS